MTEPISLFITSYNRERYLGAAIESVLAQSMPDFKLLIWDDGSTDRSVEIARDYARRDPRISLVATEHQGQSASLKAAIARTKGPYIGWVDSDDLLAPTALEETMAVLDAQPEVGFVYTDHLIIDEHGTVKGLGQLCRLPYSKDRLLFNFMTFHFRLIRRTVYDQVGGMNEFYKYAEDYDLCLRLSEVTKVRHLPKPLYYYRYHRENINHQHPVEQSYYSHQAIAQALKRRGLIDRSHRLDAAEVQHQLSLLRGKGAMNSAARRLSLALGLSTK